VQQARSQSPSRPRPQKPTPHPRRAPPAPATPRSASVQTALQSLPAEYLAQRICSSTAPPTAAPASFRIVHAPIPTEPKPIPTSEPLNPDGTIAPLEVKTRDGVRRLGRPTMDGEEEERHTSFRVPPGVKVE
jgi:hypothetical protein